MILKHSLFKNVFFVTIFLLNILGILENFALKMWSVPRSGAPVNKSDLPLYNKIPFNFLRKCQNRKVFSMWKCNKYQQKNQSVTTKIAQN